MEAYIKITQIDANSFKNALIAAANSLNEKRDIINALNVFPVPDGDTGTNMSLTLLAAAREARSVISQNVGDVAKAASSGALRGARGNSGVILSQLFRGFYRGLCSATNVAAIAAEDLCRAFSGSTQAAYSAVMKPREGTILTISRAISERAASFCKSDNPDRDDIAKLLEAVLEHGRKVLRQTTAMLPELKAAGVVDAGGEGLLTIWEAVRESLFKTGDIELIENVTQPYQSSALSRISEADIRFNYCTEFFINVPDQAAKPNIEANMMNYLAKHGDSVVVVRDEKLVKVHVHTNHPGNVLEYALTIGSLSSVKIDNMREQNHEMASFIPASAANLSSLPVSLPDSLTGEIGFIAVSGGRGFADIFTKLGVTHIIEGGQTMNPSTDDILQAANYITAENIIVLPNNKNIILAAKQAAELITPKKLYVLETTSIPQGIAAMVAYVPGTDIKVSLEQMTDAATTVTTGLVTYAVRDTELDGRVISQGDILGIIENEIVANSKSVADCARMVLEKLSLNNPEIISVYAGQDVSDTEAHDLFDGFIADFPDIEAELHNGGQPLYYYVFSAE